MLELNRSTNLERLKGRQGWVVGICLVAVLLMAVAMQSPPIALFGGVPHHALVTHTVLELFSILVSVLVVVITWHSLDRLQGANTNILILGFTIVACCDLLHMLSYEGMPNLITANSIPKGIFFWLAGRYAELAVMLLVATKIALPGSRNFWLLVALAASAAIAYLGIFHLDKFPATFIPGQGVTPFKARLEYLICVSSVAVSLWLFARYRRSRLGHDLDMAAASLIIGIGELGFTNYLAVSDFSNILGHLYKVVTYCFVFRAMFLAGLSLPFERLAESEAQIAKKKYELETLLHIIPVSLVSLDRELRCRYANSDFEKRTGKQITQLAGQHIEDTAPPEVLKHVQPLLTKALKGERVEFDYQYTNWAGEDINETIIAVPELDEQSRIDGILTIIVDNTERMRTRAQLKESQEEILGLKTALDAHAIVTVTDDRGTIIQVNDKFCEISQYSRSELVGQNHRIINSGHHPYSFFQQMWQTISRGNIWNGEVCNRAKDGSLYWVSTTIVPFLGEDGKPRQYVAIRADITKRKLAEQEIKHMAFHDALTGLGNRRFLADRLNLALHQTGQKEKFSALLLLDLDDFKYVNDTLGHAEGDELLRQVAQRLKACSLPEDSLCRFGGDEFVIILQDLGESREDATNRVEAVIAEIQTIVTRPITLLDQAVSITPSMGVVLFDHGDRTPEELLKQADIALYKAKDSGRNTVRFFDPALEKEITKETTLLRDLRQSIEHDQLRLFYQPIVDLYDNIIGVEALLRWNHPVYGMVPPADFIPLAERSSLITYIGKWVLNTACAQAVNWEDDPVRSKWTINVNVSARQFKEPDFVHTVEQALICTGAKPDRLTLELTESALNDDLTATRDKMISLRERGVRFSLDDFGTGYSSMSYLKQLPLNQIKIDKSFVRDVPTDANDAAIVAIILSLAKILELRVVAEGVETAEQRHWLLEHGCQAFQGYLFSRPVPIEALAHELARV